ncbi:MAG: dTDP-4-dehydrorhamnose reductase [Candidatus Woesearchaeota archaeon]|jgi:dTDP-4-dehydrorhamnose reductase|nr:dTDP-4-dehydrorhamnose reductase [Candidatus Woesearchaeota archaeon]
MKILILGAKGMLGTDLKKLFPDATAYDLPELDITDKQAVDKAFSTLMPEAVINAAAYTDVDGAESNEQQAYAINADAVKNIAEAAKKINAIVVHYSTDYVFEGKDKEGYKEEDYKNPLNVYGNSKSQGEDFLINETKQFYLIRTAWLFGKNGKNFVYTMMELGKTKPELSVVNDQIGSPTYTVDLARVTKQLLDEKKPFGVYHATNSGSCSWHEFACEIMKQANLSPKVSPCTTDEFPRPAKRPSFSILKNTKLPKLRQWKQALKAFMEEIS